MSTSYTHVFHHVTICTFVAMAGSRQILICIPIVLCAYISPFLLFPLPTLPNVLALLSLPTPLQYSHIGLLACGTGIAPMIQVIRAIVENEDEDTFVQLLYASRSVHDIILKTLLDGWACYWNFTVLYALSRATEEGVASGKIGRAHV